MMGADAAKVRTKPPGRAHRLDRDTAMLACPPGTNFRALACSTRVTERRYGGITLPPLVHECLFALVLAPV
jgi:hypothetical protein